MTIISFFLFSMCLTIISFPFFNGSDQNFFPFFNGSDQNLFLIGWFFGILLWKTWDPWRWDNAGSSFGSRHRLSSMWSNHPQSIQIKLLFLSLMEVTKSNKNYTGTTIISSFMSIHQLFVMMSMRTTIWRWFQPETKKCVLWGTMGPSWTTRPFSLHSSPWWKWKWKQRWKVKVCLMRFQRSSWPWWCWWWQDKRPEDDGGPTDHPFAHHDNHKRGDQHTQGLDRILVKTIFNYFKPQVSIYPTK